MCERSRYNLKVLWLSVYSYRVGRVSLFYLTIASFGTIAGHAGPMRTFTILANALEGLRRWSHVLADALSLIASNPSIAPYSCLTLVTRSLRRDGHRKSSLCHFTQ